MLEFILQFRISFCKHSLIIHSCRSEIIQIIWLIIRDNNYLILITWHLFTSLAFTACSIDSFHLLSSEWISFWGFNLVWVENVSWRKRQLVKMPVGKNASVEKMPVGENAWMEKMPVGENASEEKMPVAIILNQAVFVNFPMIPKAQKVQ